MRLRSLEMQKIKELEEKKEGRIKNKRFKRRCLRCEKIFTAIGKFTRLCDICKKQNQSIDSSQL